MSLTAAIFGHLEPHKRGPYPLLSPLYERGFLPIEDEGLRQNQQKKLSIWTLEDGTELWDTKWNGEVYEQDGKEYKPVYEEDPDFEDQFDLIGFEEV